MSNSLVQVFEESFTANHLLTFSLVKDTAATGFKPHAFFFVGVSPGIKSSNGRSYDVKNKLTLKYDAREIAGLGELLVRVGSGDTRSLPYAKFAQIQGIQKRVTVNILPPKQDQSNQQVSQYQYSILFSVVSGQSDYKIVMEKSHATGLGLVLLRMFNDAYELNKAHKIANPYRKDNSMNFGNNNQNYSANNQSTQSNQGQSQYNAQQGNQIPPPVENFNEASNQFANAGMAYDSYTEDDVPF